MAPDHVDDEDTFEIGDLGCFSMATISDALANSERLKSQKPISGSARRLNDRGDDSDCSWTQEEDNGRFYFDIRRQLDTFVLTEDQSTMTTVWLARPQRRFVHAIAQIMQLGHASLGAQGKNRRMVIFKHNTTRTATSDLKYISTDAPSSRDRTSHFEAARSRKRRRLPKSESGFPCQFNSCGKLFDRASERRKHEESHQAAFTNRFPCSCCDKAFRYPKDLRRHQRVHEKAAGSTMSDFIGTSCDSTRITSTLTSESRVPSEGSLTFSNETLSKDNSPFLVGMAADAAPHIDIDPLILGEAWVTGHHSLESIDNDFGLPFQDLLGFGSEENDGGEEFLEMAIARK